MQYRTMGSSDLTVSALGFGCWEMGGNQYGEVDDEEERRAVQRAIDLGVTLFDTAAVYGYGHSEEVLGRALGSRRSEIVLSPRVVSPGTRLVDGPPGARLARFWSTGWRRACADSGPTMWTCS